MSDPGPSPVPVRPLLELVEVMARLRRECAWKADQTHESLARYLLEETYEAIEAIESGDDDHLREELGDLLLQVLFHAVIAEEQGRFDIDDVAADLVVKLRRRNPHVFAPDPTTAAADPEAINEQWERIKAEEKQRSGLMEGVPEELPALLRATKALDRLARSGAGPEVDPGSIDLGDRLLALVVEARHAGVDPEQALRAAVRRITSHSAAPAHWPADTQVSVRRTGGFGGLVRECTLRIRDLPAADADRWRHLLAGDLLRTSAGAPTHPDAFSYQVRCDAAGVDVTVPEPALRSEDRELLERALTR